ncbi:hypothetical protein LSPH24S_08612 [Lysinibacillus sphaericus]
MEYLLHRFLMPYLQKKYNSNIKAGVITGLIFGIYVLPGYVITSFELAAIFPLYVIQLMLFLIFISYMFMRQTEIYCFTFYYSGSIHQVRD